LEELPVGFSSVLLQGTLDQIELCLNILLVFTVVVSTDHGAVADYPEDEVTVVDGHIQLGVALYSVSV
jgi:hypothetical protein